MLKSRKAQMALAAILIEFIIAFVPGLEMNREILALMVGTITVGFMGTHALTDIAAINRGPDKS